MHDLQDVTSKRPARRVPTPRSAIRTLVTGGSGFIGQHVVAALRERGDRVRLLDLRPPPDSTGTELMLGSVLDPSMVRRAMLGVERVYHLAGISHLWTPNREDYDRVNHIGTRIVLSAAAEMRIKRFIHCSSEAVLCANRRDDRYVQSAIGPDDMPGDYTRSKFLGEQAALTAAQNGLAVTLVSPTATIGPGDRNATAPTAMLAMFVRRPPPLVLDGLMNLVDVRDVAAGILLADSCGRVGERYVLGGENIRICELLDRLAKLLGRRRISYPLPGQVALGFAFIAEWIADHITHRSPIATAEGVRLALRSTGFDTHKAASELGYRPRPLTTSLAETVLWLCDH